MACNFKIFKHDWNLEKFILVEFNFAWNSLRLINKRQEDITLDSKFAGKYKLLIVYPFNNQKLEIINYHYWSVT